MTTSLITYIVVNVRPYLDDKHHRVLCHHPRFSFTKDCRMARLRISGSNKGRARIPREMSVGPSSLISGLRLSGRIVTVDISSS